MNIILKTEMLNALESAKVAPRGLFLDFKMNTSLNKMERPVPTLLEEAVATVKVTDENGHVLAGPVTGAGRSLRGKTIVFMNTVSAGSFSGGIFVPLNCEQIRRARNLEIRVEGKPFYAGRNDEGIAVKVPIKRCAEIQVPEEEKAVYEYKYDLEIGIDDMRYELFACSIECTQGNYRNDCRSRSVSLVPVFEGTIKLDAVRADVTGIDDSRGLLLDSLYEAVACFGKTGEYRVVTGYGGIGGNYDEVAGIVRTGSNQYIGGAPFQKTLAGEEYRDLQLGQKAFSAALSFVDLAHDYYVARAEQDMAHITALGSREEVLQNVYLTITEVDEFEASGVAAREQIHVLLAAGVYVTYSYMKDGQTFSISKDVAEYYGIDLECINEAAMRNSMEKYPAKYEKLARGIYMVSAKGSPCPETVFLYNGVLANVSDWLTSDIVLAMIRGEGVLICDIQAALEAPEDFFENDEFIYPSFDYERETKILWPDVEEYY